MTRVPDRGNAIAGLLVVLLATAALAPAAAPAPVVVRPAGAARSIPPDLFGVNSGSDMVRTGCWRDPAFLAALAALAPATLRLPAGTIANYWDWRAGWFTPSCPRKFTRACHRVPARLDDLAATLAAASATPVWDLNLLTSTLPEQLAFLREVHRRGLPLPYVELGNELYLDWPDNRARFPSGADYGREAARWIAAIRREFPGSRVAVVAAASKLRRQRPDPRRDDWNAQVLAAASSADALTLHLYERCGAASGPVLTPADVAAVLARPFAIADNLQRDLASLPAGLSIWITEYNIHENDPVIEGLWLHGLVLAAETLLLMDCPRITLLQPHSLIGQVSYGMLFHGERSFSFGRRHPWRFQDLRTTRFGRSALGHALLPIGAASRGMTWTQRLDVAPAPQLPGAGAPRPALLGRLFGDGMRRRALLLNLAATPLALAPAGLPTGRCAQLWADPVAAIASDSCLQRRIVAPLPPGVLTLPPFSVTLLAGR